MDFNSVSKFLRKNLGESAREDRGIFGGRGGRNNAKKTCARVGAHVLPSRGFALRRASIGIRAL